MKWTKKKVTVVAKAYPEKSKKHGIVACTAGLTEEGEWVRLYPLDMTNFIGKTKISKYDVIEVECRPDKDKLGRRENFRVRPGSIRIVDRSLTKPKVDWKRRNSLLLARKDSSIDELKKVYKQEKRSLGIIKPRWIHDFVKTDELEVFERNSWSYTQTLDGRKIPNVCKIPHIFKYKFSCYGCGDDDFHLMQCEDWELFESYRSWGTRYRDPETLWEKLKAKYFGWMLKERDLHFIMGMHSQYPSWFIIGIYYPPRR